MAVASWPVAAQFTGSRQTNVISGVISNWPGDYYVASNHVFNALLVQNGGVLRNAAAYIGYGIGASSNTVVVSGAASSWRSSGDLHLGDGLENSLVISNGGEVVSSFASWGARSNRVIMTGAGSIWKVNGEFAMHGASHSLTVSDGAAILNVTSNFQAVIGFTEGSNTVVVTGTGSLFSASVPASVGYSSTSNILLIHNAGTVSSPFGYIGFHGASSNNLVELDGESSVWAIQNTFELGYYGARNTLVVGNGARWSNPQTIAGHELGANGNAVVVTGSGTIWSNVDLTVGLRGAQNVMVISNNGALFTESSTVGTEGGGNVLLITGHGSVWSNRNVVRIGEYGTMNRCVVSNGAIAVSSQFEIGVFGGANRLVVTGTGSMCRASSLLHLGYTGDDNSLMVGNGGTFITSNVYVGFTGGARNVITLTEAGRLFATNVYVGYDAAINAATIDNRISVSGGTLVVSDTEGGSVVDVRGGTLTLNSGTAIVDKLVVVNGARSAVLFNGGVLVSKTTTVTNGQQFYVGDGTNSATFRMPGGVHSFSSGLHLRAHGLVAGCGTINGSVIIDAGATVLADCDSGFKLSSTVVNNGVIIANGAVVEVFGNLLNNGRIILINGGTTNFHGNFFNNGVVTEAGFLQISRIARTGQDLIIEVPSITGLIYRLQSAASLNSPAWMNTGAAQPGTGAVLTFTEAAAISGSRQQFYRVQME